ncbi:MAG: rod shape-determining protein MreC [Candidatus Polarisedimenticolia bacterium]
MSERLATLVYAIVAVLLLALMGAQAQRMESAEAVTHSYRGTTGRAWQGVLGVAGGLQRIWENYLYAVGAKGEREQLLAKVNKLETDRARFEEVWRENRRLRELLSLKEDVAYERGVVGRVVADLSSGPLRRAVLVDKGYGAGVGRGWVAVSRGALVGQVRDVQSDSAEIVLIVDPDSGVGVRHQQDRFAGILRGGGRGPMIATRLEYVPRDQAVAVGDVVVTSGLDGVFPAGLLVGYVRDMWADSPLTWRIAVEPAADMGSLEEVLLVPPNRRPPTPKPAPTAPTAPTATETAR